ncbi:Retrovirus-related Pol polyprotein from transposon 412 [Mycena venus]|uniref:Retrovirus-related Pol polyprotein from transposon 412 n=1 Tax=Mycena venus TaxID=2733690 RepID=A0A8H7DGI5_9AGAR|nr:Retrovirus-related Pol polyprotein from transposon 412 [Mycena venus]
MPASGTAHVRDTPPHLPDPVVPPTGNGTGPDVTTGNSVFLSARSATNATVVQPEFVSDSGPTTGERTTSPTAPTGLRVEVKIDENGMSPPDPATQATPSSTSDMLFTGSQASLPARTTQPPLEDVLDSLFNVLNDPRYAYHWTYRSLDHHINECASKQPTDSLNYINESVYRKSGWSTRSARTYAYSELFGSTEEQLDALAQSMVGFNTRSSPRPEIPALVRSASRSITPLDPYQSELDAALSPKMAHETSDAYFRRGASTVERRERTATAFTPQGDVAFTAGFKYPAPSASAAHFAKNARFEDVGSISTANVRPLPNYTGSGLRGEGNVSAFSQARGTEVALGGHGEVFHHDQERLIRRIAHREIGEVLNLPPHIRSVKTDAPPKYKGDDDLDMLCGYDPDVDKYRTSILKSHLEGPALEWFIQNISNPPSDPVRELTFTDTLCALHQRFITSANAQRATRAFDQVRFNNATGPDDFAEQLLKRANLMHHDFPPNIRYKLKVDREMMAEYTPFASLRNCARHFWRTMNEDSPHNAGTPRSATPAQRTTLPAVAPPRRNPAAAAPSSHTPPLPRAPNSEDTRTCFKCGIVGHIGNNPKCPRFNDPSTVHGARVGAQRVLESYADEGEALYDDNSGELDAGALRYDDEMEGLYGGDQSRQDEVDPNTAPDLAQLIDTDDNDEVRVGAIRARYFSMRIAEPDSETGEEVDREPPPVPGPGDPDNSAAVLDLERFELRLPSNGSYPEWDAAEEARQSRIASTTNPAPVFGSRLAEFGPSSKAASAAAFLLPLKRWSSSPSTPLAPKRQLAAYGGISSHCNPPMMLAYSRSALRTTAVNVEEQGALFTGLISDVRRYQQDLLGLLSRSLEALDEITRLQSLPTSADSSVGRNLQYARDSNRQLCADLDRHIAHLERLLQRLLESQYDINEELTRRMLAREAYALGHALRPSSSSVPRDIDINLTVASKNDAMPTSDPNPRASPETSPPPVGSTPPPSYPGSPDSSNSEGLWDALANNGDAPNSTLVPPSNSSPIWISDSDEDAHLSPLIVPDSSSSSGATPSTSTDLTATDETVEETHTAMSFSISSTSSFSPSDEPSETDGNPPELQLLTHELKLAPAVERLSNIRRADTSSMVGLHDQPKRVRSNMACLSALLSIGSSHAYMLFDSGSNTDSITPEYAHATDLPRIRLEEQVTLQLGCVGSRSKISYGTRAPIDFGGN